MKSTIELKDLISKKISIIISANDYEKEELIKIIGNEGKNSQTKVLINNALKFSTSEIEQMASNYPNLTFNLTE